MNDLDIEALRDEWERLHPTESVHYMPWGKYKDRPLLRVPMYYLNWLLTIDIKESLRQSVREAIQHKSNILEIEQMALTDDLPLYL